eukprot:PhM_4_TR8379/c3_g1_i3/m.65979
MSRCDIMAYHPLPNNITPSVMTNAPKKHHSHYPANHDSVPTAVQLYKTMMCPNAYQAATSTTWHNNCPFAHQCNFAHNPNELRTREINVQTALKIQCGHRAGVDPARYKLKMCQPSNVRGKQQHRCPCGSTCMFAHSPDEVRPMSTNLVAMSDIATLCYWETVATSQQQQQQQHYSPSSFDDVANAFAIANDAFFSVLRRDCNP